MFGNKKKITYKIVFLRKEYNTMNVVKVLKVKALNQLIKLGSKTFVVDYRIPSYNSGLVKIYFLDFDSGSQIGFDVMERKLNPIELDLIVSHKLIKEITSGVMDTKKEKIFYLIIGAIMGLLLGSLVVMTIMQGKIDQIISDTTILPMPFLPTGG